MTIAVDLGRKATKQTNKKIDNKNEQNLTKSVYALILTSSRIELLPVIFANI